MNRKKENLLKALLGVLGLLIVTVFAVDVFISRAANWRGASAVVALPDTQWKVLFDSSRTDKIDHPSSDEVLQSTFLKSDLEHRDRKLKQGSRPFWLAAEVTSDQLSQVSKSGANVLVLGNISAPFRVWFDDEFQTAGDGVTRLSTYFTLPPSRLSSLKPLRVMVEIRNIYGWRYPDMLDVYWGGPGFTTSERFEAKLDYEVVMMVAKPLCFFLINFLMCITFFAFWASGPEKQELFVMFCYTLLHSVSQLCEVSGLWNLDPIFRAKYLLATVYLEGVFGFALGFAFSRKSKKYFSYSIVLLTLPMLVFFFWKDLQQLRDAEEIVGRYFTAQLTAVGGLICWIEAIQLRRNIRLKELKGGVRRVQHLIVFGAGLLLIAAIYFNEAGYFSSATHMEIYFRIVHLGIVFFLGGILVADYRKMENSVNQVRFAEQIAHDIRSPLAALKIGVGSLKDISSDTRVLIELATARIAGIAEQLLAKRHMSQFWEDTDSVERVSVREAVESVLAEKRLEYRGRTDLVFLEEVANPLYIKADLLELKRVLSNLINNAVEAIEAPGRVTVRAFAVRKSVCLEIDDTGRGISEELIGELGRRGKTTGKLKGNGLGLYHARNSLARWGASLRIQSTLGTGSTIILEFPR